MVLFLARQLRHLFKMLARVSMDELQRSLSGPRPPKVIDVREAEEFARGHLKQAELIPLPRLAKEIKTRIPNQNDAVVLYDDLGIRSHHAARLLRSMGYQNVKEIWGGLIQ
jgi:rhodanese-related sulfurtransferase